MEANRKVYGGWDGITVAPRQETAFANGKRAGERNMVLPDRPTPRQIDPELPQSPNFSILIPMRPSEALARHRNEIRTIVSENRSSNPRVFGSVLRGEDADGSDLDLLIDPAPDTSLMDIARIQGRLEGLLGISVDVLTPLSLPESYRGRVIAEARPV